MAAVAVAVAVGVRFDSAYGGAVGRGEVWEQDAQGRRRERHLEENEQDARSTCPDRNDSSAWLDFISQSVETPQKVGHEGQLYAVVLSSSHRTSPFVVVESDAGKTVLLKRV